MLPWLPWVPASDQHGRRREKLTRRMGLAGRVLRDVAWPGNPLTDFRIAAERLLGQTIKYSLSNTSVNTCPYE